MAESLAESLGHIDIPDDYVSIRITVRRAS